MRIEVAAGILCSGGRVLITERVGDPAFAGLWEFPGGKLDHGESAERALGRELFEELGVRIRRCSHLTQLEHDYPDRLVRIDFFLVTDWSGHPRGRDGQALRWLRVEELTPGLLLPADAPVLEALRQIER